MLTHFSAVLLCVWRYFNKVLLLKQRKRVVKVSDKKSNVEVIFTLAEFLKGKEFHYQVELRFV